MQTVKSALKFLFIDILWSVVYFLPWWYYRGTLKIIGLLRYQAKDLVRTLNLKILARFLFTPMYGLNDIVSRLISFPVRVVHFSLLMIIAVAYMTVLILILLLWLIVPVFVLYNILYQIGLMPVNIFELWT